MKIKRDLERIINELDRIPPRDKEIIIEYLEQHEWELALENICAVIRDEKIRINEAEFETLKKAGLEMGSKPILWEEIVKMVGQ